ncbi:FUSC family protein [Tuberibacillus sp. Marseille-P3662]|uniref:FUSC family protein n=1 Tax=Tuberibacillus sp. Marseille-P3662 TaxID=1965358 RepID=UPI001592F96F|nr:FUSC family protein [Tuberibacillus sp. Marseille-P3662]
MLFRESINVFQKIGLTFQVAKTALAAGLSWFFANNVVDSAFPIFAPLAAILIIQVAVFDTLERAFYRVMGAVGGVCIGIIIGQWLPLNALSITLVVLISFGISTALKFPPYLLVQISVSALLVLFFGQQEAYALARIFETLIGSVTGVLINILIRPPNPIPAFERRMPELCHKTATVLRGVEMSNQSNHDVMYSLLEARRLVAEAEDIFQELESARKNLRYSPLQKKARSQISELIHHMKVIERMIIQVRGIVRSLMDINTKTDHVYNLSKTIRSVSGCLNLFGSFVSYSNKVSVELLRDALNKAQQELESNYHIIHEQEKDTTVIMNLGSVFTDFSRILLEIKTALGDIENRNQGNQ